MKKKLIAALVAVAALSGFAGYLACQEESALSVSVLANVEALSSYELPEVEIVCDGGRTGQCWELQFYKPMKICNEQAYYPCRFTGAMADYCYCPC